ncbi:putative peptide maturation dehydrogenase [Stenotrophomonas rhizophila]|uniref:putative peptide maturation dehydrogenase n=1 Tax=Stenotrophomonas rhizophila TaxID=216778 RepID=UPI000FAF98D8|nr:putative peptide maturation dehydrogenase [Stenotrophomonas rhizophila]ROP73845.1 putative peptide maturation dehydrogenase [Stenotrophomonas rhizophila]
MPLPRIRRCRHLYLEPWQCREFSLQAVIDGGSGLQVRSAWRALAPHLNAPVEVSIAMMQRLEAVDPDAWQAQRCGGIDVELEALLQHGLVLQEGSITPEALADERLRSLDWWGPAAMMHWQSRWQGRDSGVALGVAGLQTAAGLRDRLGPPPPATVPPRGSRIDLPNLDLDETDILLQSRSTCRNFDRERSLSKDTLVRMLQRCFGATGTYVLDADSTFLKKNAPSAGGLHPTEAYLLIQHVDGITPGLYHYHPLDHALTRLEDQSAIHIGLAKKICAGQPWFSDAHVQVILVARFARSHWKYRNHAKAYRAVILDVGHLSQLLLTCATEQGLGAFVTAAINEKDIEAALDLEGMEQGVLAVCGFGHRSAQMATTEFDPVERVWERVP